MKYLVLLILMVTSLNLIASDGGKKKEKPSPDKAIQMLKDGNKRFVEGKSSHPHLDKERMLLAGSENQGDYAYATVIACSDSRVPVEAIFDAGIMDLFVIRVAGNVCDTDEAGTIEYGLAHVYTNVLVVLGHKQCGAVTAVTNVVDGHNLQLERNIPALVDNITPAVLRAKKEHPDKVGNEIIPYAIEENVWQGIEDLFTSSPTSRRLFNEGGIKIVGAIYDVGTGEIEWLPENKVNTILKKVEENSNRAMNEFAW
jgi:carbonic anhydrase